MNQIDQSDGAGSAAASGGSRASTILADREARRAEAYARNEAALAVLEPHLEEGVTLTHTRCMGLVEEHIFTGMNGRWLCGFPTSDTLRLSATGNYDGAANDIAPANVTHINRVPVESLALLADEQGGTA
ncbi:MAG: hypothetical protein M3Q08_01035 [Pseudomonadota bacterium]|nr:hypothetical protein [Pseudomonadota bacterium]